MHRKDSFHAKFVTRNTPIIQGVPILLENFHEYARQRIITYGKWIINSKSSKLKSFLRSEGAKIHIPTYNDRYEENSIWYKSYLNTHQGYPSDDRLLSLLKKANKTRSHLQNAV